jgi:hypothetical protein
MPLVRWQCLKISGTGHGSHHHTLRDSRRRTLLPLPCPVSIDPSRGQVLTCGGSNGVRRDRSVCLTGYEPFDLVTVLGHESSLQRAPGASRAGAEALTALGRRLGAASVWCGLAGRGEQLPGPIRPVAHGRLHPVPLRGRDEQRPTVLAAEDAGKAPSIDGTVLSTSPPSRTRMQRWPGTLATHMAPSASAQMPSGACSRSAQTRRLARVPSPVTSNATSCWA